jgi:Prolyl oligopeptidase family
VGRHYGRKAARTFMVGGSNGGHNTKMMVEDYPSEYDGGIAGYGITSHIEWMGSNTRFARNFDVLASRIADIVAARTANPTGTPTRRR